MNGLRKKTEVYTCTANRSVYDNLQTNVLQCFVNKGKGKRFFETHQAISYTLQNIIEQ